MAIANPAAWLRQHRALLARARTLQQPDAPDGEASGEADAAVTWPRLWAEVRDMQRPRLVVPASTLSLLLAATELMAPRIRGQLFDAVLQPGATMTVLWPSLRVLVYLAVAGWALNIVSSILFASARWSSAMTARVRLMEAMVGQEPAWFDAQLPGELSSRLLSEPERLEVLANRGPEKALNAALQVGGSLFLMLALDWRLALGAVALRAPLVSKVAEAAGRTVGLLGALQQQELAEANALASEALGSPHAIAAHVAHQTVLAEYAQRVESYMQVIRATLVSETVLRFTQLGIDSLTSLLLLGLGLHSVLRGRLSLGNLVAFFAYSERFAEGCEKLQGLLIELYQIRPACLRYFQLLDRAPAMRWAAQGATCPESCQGSFELINISLAFPGRRTSALRNVSLSIRAGETLAIVGPSGAGKSTLLKLLLRLYDPDKGVVCLDGRDIKELDLAWLRSRAGFVSQEMALFDLSVRDNVVLGPRECPPVPVVEAALAAAGAAEFVAALPQGLATRVGEGGRRLSGGQRQRLAVARALVRTPPILLWDEATSAVDGSTERLMHAALEQSNEGDERRTVVLVAHRLSALRTADRVAVLQNGTITELGTPAELATAGGWFESNFFPEGASAGTAVTDERRTRGEGSVAGW